MHNGENKPDEQLGCRALILIHGLMKIVWWQIEEGKMDMRISEGRLKVEGFRVGRSLGPER